jgi:hypothetical protein
MEGEPHISLVQKMLNNCWKPFCASSTAVYLIGVGSSVLHPTDFVLLNRMLLLLNTWCAVPHLFNRSASRYATYFVYRNALILGILYLTFQAFPIIFEGRRGFNMQCTGLTFLGMAMGMILGLCTQPYWNRCELSQAIQPK